MVTVGRADQTGIVHADDSILHHVRLEPGERLLWSDRPAQGVILRVWDVVLVPVGLCWATAVTAWLVAAWRDGAPLGVRGVGALALLPGIWLGVGRLFADWRVRARTLYGITDKQVIEVRQRRHAEVWSVPIHDIAPVDLTAYGSGRATIEYGPVDGPERDLRLLPAGSNWWPDNRARLELVANGTWVHELLCATGKVPIEKSRGAHRRPSRALPLSTPSRT